MEVQDAVASTLATPFAQPIIAASKSKAQKQREYRQRIAASRTPAQAAAARERKNERERNNRLRKAANLAIALEPITAAPKTRAHIQREYRQRIAASKTPAQAAAAREAHNVRDRNNRLRQGANLAIASGSLEPITAAPKTRAQIQREYRQRIAASKTTAQAAAAREAHNVRDQNNRLRQVANLAIASGSLEPITAAPKTRAQIQREYRQRIAASKTPAQAAAAREAHNVRDRNNRLRQAANLAIASGSLEATTTSSSRLGQRFNTVHIDTQRQFTDQQRQTLATEPAETTVQPSTSSDQIEVQTQSTWNTKWASSNMRFKSTFLDNDFGYACSVCGRLWFRNDLKPITAAQLKLREGGICEICVSRLRDACDFKRQAQAVMNEDAEYEIKQEEVDLPIDIVEDDVKTEPPDFSDEDMEMEQDPLACPEEWEPKASDVLRTDVAELNMYSNEEEEEPEIKQEVLDIDFEPLDDAVKTEPPDSSDDGLEIDQDYPYEVKIEWKTEALESPEECEPEATAVPRIDVVDESYTDPNEDDEVKTEPQDPEEQDTESQDKKTPDIMTGTSRLGDVTVRITRELDIDSDGATIPSILESELTKKSPKTKAVVRPNRASASAEAVRAHEANVRTLIQHSNCTPFLTRTIADNGIKTESPDFPEEPDQPKTSLPRVTSTFTLTPERKRVSRTLMRNRRVKTRPSPVQAGLPPVQARLPPVQDRLSAVPVPKSPAPRLYLPSEIHVTNVQTLIQHSNCTPFHTRTLTGIQCCYCEASVPNLSVLREHMQSAHSNVEYRMAKMNCRKVSCKIDITDLKCKLCEQNLDVLSSLKEHLIAEHAVKFIPEKTSNILEFKLSGNGEVLTCAHCSSSYATFILLLQHMNVHYRNFICQHCKMGFLKKLALMKHMGTHKTGSFECSICAKQFTTYSKYRSHRDTSHKNIECQLCDQTFKSYATRNTHILKYHKVNKSTNNSTASI